MNGSFAPTPNDLTVRRVMNAITNAVRKPGVGTFKHLTILFDTRAGEHKGNCYITGTVSSSEAFALVTEIAKKLGADIVEAAARKAAETKAQQEQSNAADGPSGSAGQVPEQAG